MSRKLFKKNQLFKGFASLITHSKRVPLSYALVIDTFSNLQTISFILTTTFNYQSPSKGPLIKCVESILNFFEELDTVSPYSKPYLLFLLLGYFLFHLCLLILLAVFQVYQQDRKKKKLVRVMAMIYLIHSRIACSLIICFLAAAMKYRNACNQTINDPWMCEQKWFILSIFLCIVNIGLALLQELFLYRVTKNKDAYAVKNNYFHQIILFHKIITIFLYFFISDQDLKTEILSAINFLLSFIAIAVLYKKLPFYNMKIMKENMIMTTLALTSSLVSLLRMSGISQNTLEIAWIFLYLLALKICFGCFNDLFHKILQGKADTPERAMHFILLLKQSKSGYVPTFFFQKECPYGILIINGFLLQNKSSSKTIKKSKSKEEYERNVYVQSIAYLEKILDTYPSSEVLLLFMAKIYMKRLKNIMKAVALIKTLRNNNLSIWANNSVEDFKQKLREVFIRESMMNDQEDKLDLIDYFHSRENVNLVKNKMLKEVEKHIEFWKELKTEQVNVKNAVMIANEIDAIYNIIIKNQQQMHSFSSGYFANYLVLFGIYLGTIQDNSNNAKKFIDKFLNTNHGALSYFLDVYSEKEAVIILPFETERFGRILDASGSAQGLFDMKKEDIIDKSLETFLSSITILQLIKVIQASSSVMTSEKIFDYLVGYAKTKSGSIFEVDITLRFYPDIQDEIRVMIFIKKRSSPNLIMIVNSSGDILDCSAKLQKRFNLPKRQPHMVKLQDIMLDYDQIASYFNSTDNEIDSDEIIKKRASDILKVSEKTASPGLCELELSSQIPNKPLSMTQSERKLSHSEKKNFLFNFTPLKSQENIQYAYNVEIKSFVIDEKSYKALTLIKVSQITKIRESNLTVTNEALSNKYETKSSDDDYAVMKKVSKIKWAFQFKQQLVKKKPDCQISPKSSDLNSPKVNKSHILKLGKSHKINQIKKDNDLQVNKASVKGKQTERESSISNSSSGNILSIKALRNFFNGDKFYYSLKKISILIYVIMIFMAILGGINLVLSDQSMEEISAGIKIVNFAGLRLAHSMRGWQMATIFYTRYTGLRKGPLDTFKVEIYNKGLEIMKSNKQLQDTAAQLQSDLLIELYRKDIRLLDFNESTNFNNNQTNTFIATNLLGNKMVFIGNTSLDYHLPIVINEVLFLINNTGNDYLLSSEKMISVTQNMLKSIIQDNITTLHLVLGAESLSVAILCLALIFSARKILNSHKNLFRSLAKINRSQIEDRILLLERVKGLLNQDIETRQFGVDALEILKPSIRENLKSKSEKQYCERESKLSFKGFILYLIKYVSISLVTLQIVTIIFVVNLLQSISNFEEFDRVNNQLQVTTKAEYRVSMLVSSFYIEMMFQNTSSVLIRNQAPNLQLKDFIDQLRQTNKDLAYAFSDTEPGSFIHELLERRICNQLAADLQDYCRIASKVGNKETGIYAVNMRLLLTVEYYTSLYFSDPNYDNAKLLVENYANAMRPLADTLEESYFVLNNYIVTTFQEQKDSFLTRTINMYIVLLVSLVFSQIIIQGVTLRKLNSLDICRRHILRIVSYKILLENKALKFYLNKHFVVKME